MRLRVAILSALASVAAACTALDQPALPEWTPQATDGVVRRVTTRIRAGDYGAVSRMIAGARAAGMPERDWRALAARAAIARGDFAGAGTHLTRAAELAPQSPEIDVLRGRLAELGRDWSRARDAYADAARKAPDRVAALVDQARTYHAEGRPMAAVALISDALEEYPQSSALLRARGEAFLAGGYAEVAIEHLSAAHRIDPDHVPTLSSLALALTAARKHVEVVELLERRRSRGLPGRLLQTLARSALLVGRIELSAEILRTRVPRFADADADAWLELSRAEFLCGNFDDAARAAARSLSGHPKSWRALVLLGHAHWWLGRPSRAKAAYLEAMRLGADLDQIAPVMQLELRDPATVDQR